MTKTLGLRFKKFDLHIHTPASKVDYRDKNATPQDIVNVALKKGLTGIAITDHHTGAWVDPIKAVANKAGLAVFPGVEIRVNGGKKGIHLIALFDVSKNTKHITQFLNTIGIYENENALPTIVNETVTGIAKKLKEYDPEALLILAHCTSNEGALSDMQGEQRSQIFKPDIDCLLGAESSETDFLNEDKKREKKRAYDLLDGGYEGFFKKKMGVFQSSDAHSLNEIGSAFTYFKVEVDVTIEDIRQSFIDRDTRIKQTFEFYQAEYPFIESMKVTGGFLADQEFYFHQGLNSILGAKGSGKSLAVELLRFCLDQSPKIPELRDDHNLKLEKCLKVYGEVEVTYSDESNRKYTVKRILNPTENNPSTVTDLVANEVKEFPVSQLFNVLFLSQNEIIKIAENRIYQRDFIDSFFDFYRHKEDIEKITQLLKEADIRFAEILKAHIQERELTKRLKSAREEIAKIDRQIKNDIFSEYSKKEKLGRSIKIDLNFVDSYKSNLVSVMQEYITMTVPSAMDEDATLDPALKRVKDTIKSVIEGVNTRFKDTIVDIEAKRKVIEKEYMDWQKTFTPVKEKYDSLVKEAGGNQLLLDQRRRDLLVRMSKLQVDLAVCQSKLQATKTVVDRRDKAIADLEQAYKTFYEERKKRCEHFTNSSSNKLNVTIKEREDKTIFRQNLMRFKKGSWLKDEEIDKISEGIEPNEFITCLLRFEWDLRTKDEHLNPIVDATKLEMPIVIRLAHHLIDEYEYKDILSLLYTSIPNDIPTIQYKESDGFKDLDELSTGQKAIALLLVALSDGSFPIVIDQPEDSLDLRSIWDDVCQKLRGAKEKRQFILTTHNSSVAVASDTDQFTVMQATANSGKVINSGSLNRAEIKKDVISYLEGGPDTYKNKRLKYNVR